MRLQLFNYISAKKFSFLYTIFLIPATFILLSSNTLAITCPNGVTVTPVSGQTDAQACAGNEGINSSTVDVPKSDLTGNTLRIILQLVTGIAGAIAFLIIILAGLKYVLSRGNPDEISKSKDTILYAVAGLLIAMAAFSIVTFVVGKI